MSDSLLETDISIRSLWQEAARRFSSAGFESPEVEARALLAGLLRCPTTHLLLRAEEKADADIVLIYEEGIERRLKREPVAYILNVKNFMGYDFSVDHRVLIPRPETELLVEDVLLDVRDKDVQSPRLLDVGTGSGCIAISLALLIPEANVEAVDISPDSLAVASRNAERKGARVQFRQGDLFDHFGPEEYGGFDMIVSNPPYVASSDLLQLEPELSYEPRHALEGGSDGLSVVRRLVQQSPPFLKPGGRLAMEIGHNQGDLVRLLMEIAGFEDIVILKDYNGFDRIAKGKKRGSV